VRSLNFSPYLLHHLVLVFFSSLPLSIYPPDSTILCCSRFTDPVLFQVQRSGAVSEFLPSSSSSSFFVLLSSTPLSIYPTDSPILLLSKYKWLPPPFKMPPSSSSSEKLLTALPCLAVSSRSSNMRHRWMPSISIAVRGENHHRAAAPGGMRTSSAAVIFFLVFSFYLYNILLF
jgi:hypothetical protein